MDKITIEELLNEVEKVEGVKINLRFRDKCTMLVDHYPYDTPIGEGYSEEDIMFERISPLLQNAIKPNFTLFVDSKQIRKDNN